MSERRIYKTAIVVNSRKIDRVIIDPHYEVKHGDTIDDSIIMELILMLDGGTFVPETIVDGFQYFKADPLALNGVTYRLIWLLEENEIYIGVVNAFRR
jgi:NDP-sugar pyrophosphorylase family protein